MPNNYNKILTKGPESALPKVFEEGKLRFTTDTGRMFVDNTNERIEITDFVKGLTEEEIRAQLAPLTSKIYISSDTNKMMYYTNKWNIIADNATDAIKLSAQSKKFGQYVSGDTHIAKLGYVTCTTEYDHLTLLITSEFWGNQHGSSDLINIQQDKNGTTEKFILTSIYRTHLGGNSNRKFYYKKDEENKRIYLYVNVVGGNGYGRWNVSVVQSVVSTWTTELESNQPNENLIQIQNVQGYFSTINANNIYQNNTPVSIEGHTHSISDITDYPLASKYFSQKTTAGIWCKLFSITRSSFDISTIRFIVYNGLLGLYEVFARVRFTPSGISTQSNQFALKCIGNFFNDRTEIVRMYMIDDYTIGFAVYTGGANGPLPVHGFKILDLATENLTIENNFIIPDTFDQLESEPVAFGTHTYI